MPSHIWKYAGRKIGKRKRDGKESDVFWNGIRLPPKKVKKETTRNFYSTIDQVALGMLNLLRPIHRRVSFDVG